MDVHGLQGKPITTSGVHLCEGKEQGFVPPAGFRPAEVACVSRFASFLFHVGKKEKEKLPSEEYESH